MAHQALTPPEHLPVPDAAAYEAAAGAWARSSGVPTAGRIEAAGTALLGHLFGNDRVRVALDDTSVETTPDGRITARCLVLVDLPEWSDTPMALAVTSNRDGTFDGSTPAMQLVEHHGSADTLEHD